MGVTRRKAKAPARRRPRAKTSDVLSSGSASARNGIPRKWREHYDRLLTLREQLSRSRADLAQDALQENPTFSTHMADAATDTYDRDVALSLLSTEQDSVYEIEQAIDRIRSGRYGICELSGKPIEPARLEAIPWTRFSVAAERQLEKEGKRKRARLGPRETVARESAPRDEG